MLRSPEALPAPGIVDRSGRLQPFEVSRLAASLERILGASATRPEHLAQLVGAYLAGRVRDPVIPADDLAALVERVLASEGLRDAARAYRRAQQIYASAEGPPIVHDLRYAAAWHSVRGEMDQAVSALTALRKCGVARMVLAADPLLASNMAQVP